MSDHATSPLRLSASPRSTGIRQSEKIELLPWVGIALLMSLIGRWIVGLHAPLWFDEAGTAAFASSDTLSELIEYAHGDSNAPLYYVLVWVWAKCFGNSDLALHILSAIFGLLAPVIAWMGLRASYPLQALIWSAALALWGPGIVLSGYARCYSLLILVSVINVITFIRLLQSPTLKRSFAWSTFAAIAILVHYDAIFMVATQAAMIILFHRDKLLRLLPAALAFLPAAAWLFWHFPRLVSYASPEHTWYKPLDVFGVLGVVTYVVGVPFLFIPGYIAVLLIVLILVIRVVRIDKAPIDQDLLRTAGSASMIACAVVVLLGVIRPSFTVRYITPFEPGILLLLTHYVVKFTRNSKIMISLIMLNHAIFASSFWTSPNVLGLNSFEYETASAWIAETKPSHLVFLWDNPSAVAVPRKQFEAMGGVFFHRIGQNVSVTALFPERGSDMNPRFAEGMDRKSGGLWIYDTSVHDTTAITEPPRLGDGNDLVECRQFGKFSFVIQACRPRSL